MPPLSRYKKEYHDDWAWSLSIKGATDEEIATAFGISRRTLNRWKNDYESFAKALEEGKDAADARVEKTLYKKALGYTYDEVEKIIDMDNNGRPSVTKTRVVTKHVPPDTMAMMYWLNNRKRITGEWSQTQNIKVSGSLHGVDLSNMTDDELRNIARLSNGEE